MQTLLIKLNQHQQKTLLETHNIKFYFTQYNIAL
jgi:hypothetical protein